MSEQTDGKPTAASEAHRYRIVPSPVVVNVHMQPMATFDPEKPCKVHDRLNDSTFEWKAGWANHWRTFAFEQGDGTVSWDGLLLDGWTA